MTGYYLAIIYKTLFDIMKMDKHTWLKVYKAVIYLTTPFILLTVLLVCFMLIIMFL